MGILQLKKIENFGKRIADFGTGGGFPGIPLAIFFPQVKFHLVDSIGKKVKVSEEISSALQLKNVTVEKQRAEELDGRYDFVVSRAVAPMSRSTLGWLPWFMVYVP